MVRIEANMRTNRATWTKATTIENLDDGNMYAMFFKLA
jgi:hypothetical protein